MYDYQITHIRVQPKFVCSGKSCPLYTSCMLQNQYISCVSFYISADGNAVDMCYKSLNSKPHLIRIVKRYLEFSRLTDVRVILQL